MFWVFVLIFCFIQILHVKWTLFFFSRAHCAVPIIAMFSVFLRFADLFFSAAPGPAHLWKNAAPVFEALGLGIDSKHDHILGLAFAFPTWIMMDLAQPWSKLKPNKQIGSQKWIIPGHQSASGGLEWLPLGSKGILTRIGLGKMILDPRTSFPSSWVEPKVLVSQECSKGCRMYIEGLPKDG